MNLPHFHIDIETLDKKSTAVIASIGVTELDFETGVIKRGMHVNIDRDDCEFYGLTVSQDTLDWWAEQSEAARARTFDPDTAVSLKAALMQLSEFIGSGYKEISARGIVFDIGILENAYNVVGLPIPWNFWEVECTRSLHKRLPEVERGDKPEGAHDALIDATHQGEHMIRMVQHLRAMQQHPSAKPIEVEAGRSDMIKALATIHNYIETFLRAERPDRIDEVLREWHALRGKPLPEPARLVRTITAEPAVTVSDDDEL